MVPFIQEKFRVAGFDCKPSDFSNILGSIQSKAQSINYTNVMSATAERIQDLRTALEAAEEAAKAAKLAAANKSVILEWLATNGINLLVGTALTLIGGLFIKKISNLLSGKDDIAKDLNAVENKVNELANRSNENSTKIAEVAENCSNNARQIKTEGDSIRASAEAHSKIVSENQSKIVTELELTSTATRQNATNLANLTETTESIRGIVGRVNTNLGRLTTAVKDMETSLNNQVSSARDIAMDSLGRHLGVSRPTTKVTVSAARPAASSSSITPPEEI